MALSETTAISDTISLPEKFRFFYMLFIGSSIPRTIRKSSGIRPEVH